MSLLYSFLRIPCLELKPKLEVATCNGRDGEAERDDHDARKLSWARTEEAWTEARQLHGCYHLRTSLDMPDQELWELYMTLTRVEDGFRSLKAELGLRPFRHQIARRCRGHIWYTILAYHLLRWIEHTLELSGYQGTWRTLKRRLQTHCYCTLIVPIEERLVHHTRKPGKPNEVQRLIYSLFGIDCSELPVRKRTYRRRAASV